MDEVLLKQAFEVIGYAGNGKSNALRAIDEAEKGDFEKAEQLIKEGRREIASAQKIQTGFVKQEMESGVFEKSIVLIHAEDHFMGAITALDLAQRMIAQERRLQNLSQRVYLLEGRDNGGGVS